jgi:putative transcriptional regulator
MVRINLSRIMGERRLKIADVCRDTGLSRTTVSRLYHEDVIKLDLETLELLCNYLDVDIAEMIEITR